MSNESNTDWLSRFDPIENEADWEAQGWSNEPEPLTAAAELDTVISIRLDPAAASIVARAARKAGLGRAEFARRAAIRAAANMVGQEPSAPAGSDDSESLASSV